MKSLFHPPPIKQRDINSPLFEEILEEIVEKQFIYLKGFYQLL